MKQITFYSHHLESDQSLIQCVIRTPQFKNGKIDRYKEQEGTFCEKTLQFQPSNKITGHPVQFNTLEDFKACVK